MHQFVSAVGHLLARWHQYDLEERHGIGSSRPGPSFPTPESIVHISGISRCTSEGLNEKVCAPNLETL